MCSIILISGLDLLKIRYKLTTCQHDSVCQCVQLFLSVALICISNSLPGFISDILISGSDLLRHWRVTHLLDVCSTILISGSDLPKDPKSRGWTHMLDAYSTILVNGTDLLIHFKLRVTHKLYVYSCQWFRCSNTEERDSQSASGWMFSHSGQWFWPVHAFEWTHWLDVYSVFLVSSSDLLKSDSQPR